MSLRQRAQYAVFRATQEGRLARLDGSIACVDCGLPARGYDHRDYSKPLAVEPVCRGCNRKRGPAIGKEGIARVLVELPEDLIKDFKRVAVDKDTSLKALVADALRKYLERERGEK
jgi:hypothetical protein